MACASQQGRPPTKPGSARRGGLGMEQAARRGAHHGVDPGIGDNPDPVGLVLDPAPRRWLQPHPITLPAWPVVREMSGA